MISNKYRKDQNESRSESFPSLIQTREICLQNFNLLLPMSLQKLALIAKDRKNEFEISSNRMTHTV